MDILAEEKYLSYIVTQEYKNEYSKDGHFQITIFNLIILKFK